MTKGGKVYNLEERTAKFGENIIELSKVISRNTITLPIINQLIKLRNNLTLEIIHFISN